MYTSRDLSVLLRLIDKLSHPSLAVNTSCQQLTECLVDRNFTDQRSFLSASIFLDKVKIVSGSGGGSCGFSLAGHGYELVSESYFELIL